MSDQLRELIDGCGLSRYALSKLTRIDEATLSRFMHGERGLSMKALDRLGAVLDLRVMSGGIREDSQPAKRKGK